MGATYTRVNTALLLLKTYLLYLRVPRVPSKVSSGRQTFTRTHTHTHTPTRAPAHAKKFDSFSFSGCVPDAWAWTERQGSHTRWNVTTQFAPHQTKKFITIEMSCIKTRVKILSLKWCKGASHTIEGVVMLLEKEEADCLKCKQDDQLSVCEKTKSRDICRARKVLSALRTGLLMISTALDLVD